ncbi:MAG: tRNA 2-thiouridine(34) synthase MnmA [Lachnospiraceae bacterium]|nr:tRNA 2-thiouridine(34) synthase MnmA [Lachnospiraceae bacterium]
MKALIAMSGGVDSSVSAYLMKEKGYDCMGITMKLFHNEDIVEKKSKSCCALDDVEDARNVAFRLDIPYYVVNFSADFKKEVIGRFIDCYEHGATPNPCIDCNRHLKFNRLYERGKELGCNYIVTGHYARIKELNGRYVLMKAADLSKDQSYVLYSLTQDQLEHTIFPLGAMTKDETRKIADEQGFFNANKPDSQDICFVPDGDYIGFIKNYTGKDYPSGNFIDKDNNIFGTHKGIIAYTIGQRKGLGITYKEPLYVTNINPEDNTVTLGSNSDLFKTDFDAAYMNWIMYDTPPKEFKAKAKIRYKQTEQPATITVDSDDISKIHVSFDEPQRAITKGQAVVLYDGEYVIGGGVIQ